MSVKAIAFYLPQFHTFPENDLWWGKGFTEWTNTAKAKPLFKGHYQPHVPYGENYYNLLDEGIMKQQIEMAKKYGVYGFCFYHYWFSGKLLMEKPVENFLNDKTLDFHFCLSWANESWSRRWDGSEQEILIEQKYGDESEWEKHFYYLLPFFRDPRYITINGYPVIVIYRPDIIPCYDQMIAKWRRLARENGIENLYVMAQGSEYCASQRVYASKDETDAFIMYEPGYSIRLAQKMSLVAFRESFSLTFAGATRIALNILSKPLQKKQKLLGALGTRIITYDVVWKTILRHAPFKDAYPGAFVSWDNTARRGIKARIIKNSTPDKFKLYFQKQLKRAIEVYHKEYIFITAWNEWAEGSHLEPDEKYGYKYLEALKDAIHMMESTDE